MENFIIIGILALIIGGIIFYLIREKKRGVKCIGCPHGKQCCGNCAGCTGCTGHTEKQENKNT